MKSDRTNKRCAYLFNPCELIELRKVASKAPIGKRGTYILQAVRFFENVKAMAHKEVAL